MTTAAAPENKVQPLRASLAASLERRANCRLDVYQRQKNVAEARQQLGMATSKLASFEQIDSQITRWRADQLKAGRAPGGELPAALAQEKLERDLAVQTVTEAKGVVDLLETELTAAGEELQAAEIDVKTRASAVVIVEADKKAAAVLKLREQLWDAVEEISPFAAMPAFVSRPGQQWIEKQQVSAAMDEALRATSYQRSYPVASDPSTVHGQKWTSFFERLCEDAGAQLEQ